MQRLWDYFLILQWCLCPVEVKSIQASITKHKALLRSMLECQYGLLDELYSRCVLTDEQLDLIKSKVPTYEKNDLLLREISKETKVFKLNEFLSALNATHQSHLSTYIVNNGSKILRNEIIIVLCTILKIHTTIIQFLLYHNPFSGFFQ